MEKVVTCSNGKEVKFRMTMEKGFFTSHIWVYKNGKPYLHIVPNKKNNSSNVNKKCEKYGYLHMCELMKPFDEITLDDICGL